MIKAALTSFVVAGLLVVPASAQSSTIQSRGAPITKGVTTGDLSVQVDQARQSAADLLIQVNRQEDQISTLAGRVESLEFELGRAREANQDLLTDNETLARDAQASRRLWEQMIGDMRRVRIEIADHSAIRHALKTYQQQFYQK